MPRSPAEHCGELGVLTSALFSVVNALKGALVAPVDNIAVTENFIKAIFDSIVLSILTELVFPWEEHMTSSWNRKVARADNWNIWQDSSAQVALETLMV